MLEPAQQCMTLPGETQQEAKNPWGILLVVLRNWDDSPKQLLKGFLGSSFSRRAMGTSKEVVESPFLESFKGDTDVVLRNII